MTLSVPEACGRLRGLILEQYAPGFPRPIGDDEVLTEIGALDSLRMVEFVLSLEQMFDIRVEAADITPDNFGSIRSIAAYVVNKKQIAA